MIQIYEGSVLELQGYELISLSHAIRMAENMYYLIEIFNKKLQKKLFAWEQKDIIASFFHKSILDLQLLQEKGKQLEKQTKWPKNKVIAVQQIRRKFLAEHSESSDHNYEFQQQLKQKEACQKQNEKTLQKKIQKENISQERKFKIGKNNISVKNEKQEIATALSNLVSQKRLQYCKQRNKINKNSIKQLNLQNMNSEPQQIAQQNKQVDEIDFTSIFMQKMKKQAQKQHPIEYYKIKKMKIRPKKRQINYIVENILGESQYISGRKLKKTHLFDMIVFLEDYLQVKK